jgi:small subunit ribosomal protein S20
VGTRRIPEAGAVQEPSGPEPGRDVMTTAVTLIDTPPWGPEPLSWRRRRYQRSRSAARTCGRSEVAGRLPLPMANIKSQIKRNKQNETRRERNKGVKTALKTSTKKVQAAIADGDADAATVRQREAARALDKAASKGVLHKRTVARKKSRLAKQVNATSAA